MLSTIRIFGSCHCKRQLSALPSISARISQLDINQRCSVRGLSTSSEHSALRRSYLYAVPASSDRMLEKSLTTESDIIIYDLEDSVPPSAFDKESARQRLSIFLSRSPADKLPRRERVAVRLNDITTPFFEDDISEILKHSSVGTLVLPKIHAARDLDHVSRTIRKSLARSPRGSTGMPLRIVASLESARGTWNLGDIASWTSEHGPEVGGKLGALLFAAEDYCADTSVVRTPSRQELLFVRSQIVIAAKAFGLDAIDMVCVNYKDIDYLKDECEDGRRLGFNGKQAIHPIQVETIQSTFVPSAKEILRAAKIVHQMEVAHSSQKGAFGLEMEGGGKEMIDAPMLKQAENTMRIARAAGLEIPSFD
ncbi:citrate lyase beta subunit [Leucogyrophana mollusca]|uniref:Citrate lyase beta subunit n=1 Tax=Leucogyrophana mollusca TaxID=85980 RepID=A0ACB8BMT8_9AGAM|nr:citrate lyase beta subunit [Leucogyrophana mollusca]